MAKSHIEMNGDFGSTVRANKKFGAVGDTRGLRLFPANSTSTNPETHRHAKQQVLQLAQALALGKFPFRTRHADPLVRNIGLEVPARLAPRRKS